MAATKTIIKLSNTEAVVRISGIAGDTATIILDTDLLLPLEYLNTNPIKVNIGAVYCTGVSGGYTSIIRNSVTIMDVACKSLNPIDLTSEPFVPDSINNNSNIIVKISGQPCQVYIYLKKVSGYTSTDTAVVAPFNVLSLFGVGEQGAWYDPSDLTTLFQDSAGTTPVTLSPMEQPVGLMLDKSKGLVLGSELVTNGTFTTGTTGWSAGFDTASSTFTASGGVVSFTKVAPDLYPRFMTPLTGCVVGTTYKVTWTNVANPGGDLRLIATNMSDGTGGVQLTNAATLNQWVFVATATTMYFGFNHIGTTGTTWQIDNISVKQIAGNHAFQSDATSGKRPLLSARVNLLTKTEDFSDVAWTTWYFTSGGGTITVSPDKKSITFYTPIGGRAFMNADLPNITDTFTYGVRRVFNISSGGYSNIVCGTTVDSGVSDGYIKVTGGGNTLRRFGIINVATVESSVTFSFPDLRPTNSGALLPPYQRVNTATDYDTVGFPLYLKCNGSSSAMSTNSINFTATDKMTVVTGVRKLSDVNGGAVCELSPTSASNNGAFTLLSPDPSQTNYGWYSKGTIRITANASPYISPISNVLTGIGDISAPLSSVRVNGIVTSDTSSQGLGTYGNYPLYLFARNQASFFLNGNFYGAIIRGAQSDTNSVVQTEKYMAKQTGITF